MKPVGNGPKKYTTARFDSDTARVADAVLWPVVCCGVTGKPVTPSNVDFGAAFCDGVFEHGNERHVALP